MGLSASLASVKTIAIRVVSPATTNGPRFFRKPSTSASATFWLGGYGYYGYDYPAYSGGYYAPSYYGGYRPGYRRRIHIVHRPYRGGW